MRVARVLPVLAAGALLAGCGPDDGKPLAGKRTTTTTTSAKPTKSAPGLSPAEGSPVTVGRGEMNVDVTFVQTIHCTDNDVEVESTTGKLTFTGQCRTITLHGSFNMLTVDRAGTLAFVGMASGDIVDAKAVDEITLGSETMGNIVTADANLAGTGKPRCDDSGVENDC